MSCHPPPIRRGALSSDKILPLIRLPRRRSYGRTAVRRISSRSSIITVELGQHGRSRSNVWDYAGVNAPKFGRLEELAMHPTVKPITLVSNAIKNCSRRNGLVLDPFVGSGTVPITTERTGRKATHSASTRATSKPRSRGGGHSVERENHRIASQCASSWN